MSLEGLLLIDGSDAYTTYGAVVLKDGHKGLIQWPPLKDVETNDWHEYDGIEADLSAPILGGKTFDVDFYIIGESERRARLNALVAALRDGSYHLFNFSAVGKSVTLRATSFSDPTLCSDGLKITISFADDFPLSGYTYLAPTTSMRRSEDYLMDGSTFTKYSVRVIEGSLVSAMNMADVKENLKRDISVRAGVIYDDPADENLEGEEETVDATVRLSYRDLVLRCYMVESTLVRFWRNYNALLYDLIRPNARTVYSSGAGKTLSCYYKSSEVEKIALEGTRIGVIFSITFGVLNEVN